MPRKKQRENYGNGSVSPVMVTKDGKRVQKRDKLGRPVWRICISLGSEEYFDEDGNKCKRQVKAPQKTFHGTLEEARKFAKQLNDDYSEIDAEAAGMPYKAAYESWVSSMRSANTCSAAKLKDYETMMSQVSDELGKKPLVELKSSDVEKALISVKRKRKLSQRRYREMFQTVKRVFEYCIDNDWMMRNPCRKMKTPRVTSEVDRRSLTSAECARLRACLDRDELEAYRSFEEKEQRQREWDKTRTAGKTFNRSKLLGISHLSGLIAVRLMLATGMRRGESLGLLWENVDFENNQIVVRHSLNAQMVFKSPKTKKGIRTLYVDADTMAHLKRWKAFQKKALHLVMTEDESGKKKPVGQSDKTPVCCNCVGGLYDPTKVADWWKAYRSTIGFDTLKMHELRHTQATLLLGSGVDVKSVQTRLGHASSSLTLDIYGHAIPANDKAAADIMGAIYGAYAEPTARVIEVQKRTA